MSKWDLVTPESKLSDCIKKMNWLKYMLRWVTENSVSNYRLVSQSTQALTEVSLSLMNVSLQKNSKWNDHVVFFLTLHLRLMLYYLPWQLTVMKWKFSELSYHQREFKLYLYKSIDKRLMDSGEPSLDNLLIVLKAKPALVANSFLLSAMAQDSFGCPCKHHAECQWVTSRFSTSLKS